MSGPSDVNPFVGPRSIQQGEPLYGRKTEVRELFELLQARRIVVLHSPSGAGKSSLVQAGLIPRLRRAKFDVWRPIRVNLDPASFPDVPADTNRYLFSALLGLEDELPAKRRRSPAELARLGLLEYLDTRPRRKHRAEQSVVLLFDQFEEVLAVAPRDVAAKEAFFTEVGRALDTGKYWALFIIREDYLAALAPYRDLIPTQLFNTFRLDLLGLDGAREAAVKLAGEGGREFPAVDKLIRDLSVVQVQQADGTFVNEQGLHVEPVYLQVVCRRLWAAMPAEATRIDEHHLEAYARVSESLASYYADAVRAIAGADAALERAIRDWVGTRLITGGLRSQVRQEAVASAGLDNLHIQGLLDSYLVRIEQRAGANWFELSHDRLVEPIVDDNEAWQRSHLHPLQVQAKLWEAGGRSRALLLSVGALVDARAWAREHPGLLTTGEQEFLRQSKQRHEDELRRRRRRNAFTVALTAVTIAAVILGTLAVIAQREAEDQRREAEAAFEEAEAARVDAETARAEAEEQRREAVDARAQAEDAKTRAEKSQKDNERSVRQMFEVSLRGLIETLAKDRVAMSAIEVDERWTPLLERRGLVLVAATVGRPERIVVAGHEAVLAEIGGRGRSLFLEITSQWLLGDQARRRIAIITDPEGDRALRELERNLLALELEYELNPALDDLDALADAGMLILDNRRTAPFSAGEITTIAAFVERGGGVLAVGNPGPGDAAAGGDRIAANRVMAAFGARWTDQTVDPDELARREQLAIVSFENASKMTVNLHLRGAAGREDYYSTLAPGEERELLTALGREWIFRDAKDEREIGSVVIEDAEQIVTISERVAKKPTKPASAVVPVDEGPASETPASSATLPETLSSADMKPARDSAKKAAKACGDALESAWPSVKVQFTVAPSGEVSSAGALPPLKGSPEGTCVAEAVAAQQFPKSRKGAKTTWELPLI